MHSSTLEAYIASVTDASVTRTLQQSFSVAIFSAGLENPGLRMQGASRGAETKTAQSTHDEDHVIRLFNWKRILLLIVAITVHNIPGGWSQISHVNCLQLRLTLPCYLVVGITVSWQCCKRNLFCWANLLHEILPLAMANGH